MKVTPTFPFGTPLPQIENDGIARKLLEKNEAGEIRKPIEDEPHQDTVHNESRSRSLQSELKLTGNLQQSQLQSQVGVLANGSRGPQVKELQNQLNEWRVANGKLPIGADGVFGPKTEAAVKEFQKATGLKADGLAGPNVSKRLSCELTLQSDANYQKLSPESQKHAMLKLMERPQDPAHRANVQSTIQDALAMESDPSFQNNLPHIRDGMKYTMFEFTGSPEARKDLGTLATGERFTKLGTEQQTQVVSTILANSLKEGGDAVPAFLGNYLNSKSMEDPVNDLFFKKMMATADKIAPDAVRMWEFQELLSDPQFASSPMEDRFAMMNGFTGQTGLQ